jgi:hypothetical protein
VSWAKVDDGWWSHPKVMGLDLSARGLWVTALSWSCAHRRDVVPESFVRMIVGASDVDANALVNAGLWHEVIGGWQIHDWDEYQQQTVSEKRAEAGRKGGLSRSNASKSQANVKQNGFASSSKDEAKAQAGIPSRPDPSLNTRAPAEVPVLLPITEPDASADADGGFEEFWKLVRRKVDKRNAERAWIKATRRTDPALIRARWVVQLQRWDAERRELDKHPHAATWLNGRRWEDEDLDTPATNLGPTGTSYGSLGPNEVYR